MGATTGIAWCDATVNVWWGCTKVSAACHRCYAEAASKRYGKDVWGPGKPREDHRAGARKLALKLERQAVREGRRIRVFSASMSDWLDEEVPPEWLAELLCLIDETPHLRWLLLTKRPQLFGFRMRAVKRTDVRGSELARRWLDGLAPRNAWVGTTVEDQQRADERIPELLSIPARLAFLSCEPLLEPVSLRRWMGPGEIGYVIAGGESGHGARRTELEWLRSLRDECAAADVPYFLKQLGGHPNKRANVDEFPEDLRIQDVPT